VAALAKGGDRALVVTVGAGSSIARWPKFRPKSSKGAGEKKCWPEELVAEFWPKFAEKRAKKFFERISLFYSNDKHSVTTTKFKYKYVDTSAERCFILCENWPNFFQNWPNFFHVLAGK
jgi:hypothetical protein